MSMGDVLFGGPAGIADRLCLVRITLVISIAILVSSRYYGKFYPQAEQLFKAKPGDCALPRLSWMGKNYALVRMGIFVSCLLAVFGLGGPFLLFLIVIGFAALDCYTANFTPKIWPNLFHLHVFGILCLLGELALLIAPLNSSSFSRMTIVLMQWQVGLIYFFAGIAKLVHGGIDWPLRATSLHLIVLTNGTSIGRFLLANGGARRAASFSALTLEILLPVLLFFPSFYPLFAASAFLFHLITYGMFGISFWHLWVFFPSLFLFI